MDSGWISGYYAVILSGKEDCDLWSVCTAKPFASSLRMQVCLFVVVSFRFRSDLIVLGVNVKSFLVLVRKELANSP